MNMFSIPAILISTAIYVLPIVIYRFLIRKKPLEHKKAKWGSICYAVICYIPLLFLPTALFQAFIVIFFTIVNYFILAGIKENITGQIYLRQRFWLILSNIVCTIMFFIIFRSPEMFSDMYLRSFVAIFLPFHFFCFYKYKKVKGNVKSELERKGKLKKENIESKTEE